MHKLYVLIGASGAGKTTASTLLESRRPDIKFIFPDKEKVIPPKEEMGRLFGSVENWQKNETVNRIKRIKDEFLNNSPVFLDTQSRCEYIINACELCEIGEFSIILFDCNDQIRGDRLLKRGQPHLEKENMTSWANFLREDCRKNSCTIIDTSSLSITEMTDALEKEIL